jgi:hypothetical protein
MSPERERRRDALFDLLAANPAGLTVNDITSVMQCSNRQADHAIRDLRLFFGECEPINVTCDPNGLREPWTYRLVGNLDGVREWIANRLGDTESRIRTMQALMVSVVSASDGRKSDGRRARLIERALRHLIENLDDLAEAP